MWQVWDVLQEWNVWQEWDEWQDSYGDKPYHIPTIKYPKSLRSLVIPHTARYRDNFHTITLSALRYLISRYSPVIERSDNLVTFGLLLGRSLGWTSVIFNYTNTKVFTSRHDNHNRQWIAYLSIVTPVFLFFNCSATIDNTEHKTMYLVSIGSSNSSWYLVYFDY